MTKYKPIESAFFKKNRERLHKLLEPSSLVICLSNDLMPINADAHYPFVQQSDLYYLTGIDQEETVFIYYIDEKGSASKALFIRESNEWITTWEGYKLTVEEASKISGIPVGNILKGDWKSVLPTFLANAKQIYLNAKEVPLKNSPKTTVEVLVKELTELAKTADIVSLSSLTKLLRTVKSTEEIETIAKAIDITKQAFIFMCQQVKNATYEYELEAALTYKMLQLGADGHAFQPIVASGGAANVLHYITNHQPIKENDLILIDFGASYANYKADITRCIPASGVFSPRQKEVYTAVLTILRQCIAVMKVGYSMQKWRTFAEERVAEQLVLLGLLKDEDNQDEVKKKAVVKAYFPHGIGHHLGLDVHDTCDYSLVFQEGMLLTCEPGIYIKEESIGIRLETDVLITQNGPVDLGEQIPIEITDIENLIE